MAGLCHPAHCIASLLPTHTATPVARFPLCFSHSLLQAVPNNPASNQGKTAAFTQPNAAQKRVAPWEQNGASSPVPTGAGWDQGSTEGRELLFLLLHQVPPGKLHKRPKYCQPKPSFSQHCPAQPGPLQTRLGTSL